MSKGYAQHPEGGLGMKKAKDIHSAYEKLMDQFRNWAENRSDIRTVMVIGSRARTILPADEWSDLDLVFITTDPNYYLSRTDWIDRFGTVRITFLERTAVGEGKERRVLFDGGLDVDFVPVTAEFMEELLRHPEGQQILQNGFRIILDKDRFGDGLKIDSKRNLHWRPPSQESFDQLVNDFLYHAVWTAKKLRRGEIWVAKSCCDSYMKRQLLQMLQWHAQPWKDRNRPVWHDGRFLEEWVDPRALKQLDVIFARYDQVEIGQALLATMELFRWLAEETAEELNFPDYREAMEYTVSLVTTLLSIEPPNRRF